MEVTAISEEKLKDDFGVDIEIGDEVLGIAKRYSQKYIWIDIMLDTTINPSNEDEFLNGIINKSVKLKIKQNSIKRRKCNYCDNFIKENFKTCGSEDCEYRQINSEEPDDYSLCSTPFEF